MTKFGAYGIARSASAAALDGDLARVMEEIQVRGFSALPSLIPLETVDRLNGQMDEIYARQCAEVGGEAALASMNDADIARCLLAYSDDYMSLATHPAMIAVAQALLGENLVLLMQNGVINRPGRRQAQASWHRDLNYQHWVCSRAISMSALVCLEDFNPETGGTTFLPGSHLIENFPSEAIVEQ
ncbi:MAG TPA: phytanoyl-CoA dioxygenase family protein, partial [Phenylobacterium sp.]|uniref:phytanoyl-CoA dioxygenase family protein n=1 Tax=Phenylobacterium sp. TaxID=1871053 RepID=UPI002D264F56